MKKVIILLLIVCSTHLFAQENNSLMELKQAKQAAIENEDYQKAAELKLLIEKKEKEITNDGGKTLAQLTTAKQDAINNEDYILADKIKQQIETRKNYLKSQLELAVKNENYESAAKIKAELEGNSNKTNSTLSSSELSKNTESTEKEENTIVEDKYKGLPLFIGVINNKALPNIGYSGYSSFCLMLETLMYDKNDIIGPAMSFQIGGGSIDYDDEYVDYSYGYSQIAFGIGISSNFGWKNNKTPFKPFAVATLGVGYESGTENIYYSYSSYLDDVESDTDRFAFNYLFKAGFIYFLSNRFGISFASGYNNYTYISVGVAF